MKYLSAILLLAASSASAEPLTFRGAIDLALGKNPDVAAAHEAVLGADAHTAGIKARRLPSLGVTSSLNLWREPYALDFGGQAFTLHEQTTTATSVSIVQPLTGLAYLSDLVGASKHDATATRDEYDRVRLDTAYRTADAYIQVLAARARADVAHRTVTDLQSTLDRAKQLRAAETYTDLDVQRFQSAKSGADIAALRADTAIQNALAALVAQLHVPDGTQLDVSDDLPPSPPPLAMTLEQAQSRAIAARPELHAARERIASAENNRQAARYKYFPDVRAIASWQHLTGVQPFQPENEEFVGLQLNWNIWDWGATHHGVVEAEHAKERATNAANGLADRVALEVRRSWLEAKTAFDAFGISQTQVQAAEEAYRLQKVKFDNGAATTTDVLDSETEAARARLVFVVARYDYYTALVALARSVGNLPLATP